MLYPIDIYREINAQFSIDLKVIIDSLIEIDLVTKPISKRLQHLNSLDWYLKIIHPIIHSQLNSRIFKIWSSFIETCDSKPFQIFYGHLVPLYSIYYNCQKLYCYLSLVYTEIQTVYEFYVLFCKNRI